MFNTIYLLRNKRNVKIYVGQTWQTLVERGDSGHGYKSCVYLHNAIKKHGWENFYYEELYRCYTQEQADEMEIFYEAIYDSRNPERGYNIREGGSRRKLSEASKKKLSESKKGKPSWHKGKKFSEEHKQKLSKALKGRIISEEARQKNSIAHKGRHPSDETKEKMSAVHKRNPPANGFKLGVASPMKGKKHTKESRANMSKAHKGLASVNKKVFTPENEQEIKRLREEGMSMAKIGKQFGVSKTVIRRILKTL